MVKYVIIFLLLCFPISFINAEQPFGLNENHPYGILTTQYVTPHIKWANPYYKGKIKALVLAPYWSQRETVELSQRLSIDFTAWMPEYFYNTVIPLDVDPALGFFRPPPDLVYKLLDECLEKDYDVIIIGKLNWEMLPAKKRFELLKKVANGTGLIYINPSEHEELKVAFQREIQDGINFITENIPLEYLPRFQKINKNDLVKTRIFGKGRVVILDYHELSPPKDGYWEGGWHCLTPEWSRVESKIGGIRSIPIVEDELVSYEYYHALLARAVLWAGKKEPDSKIKSVILPEKMNWPVLNQEIVIELRNISDKALMKVVIRDRKEYEKVYTLVVKNAKERNVFLLPNLPSGDYFLDIWVLNSDGIEVLNWLSTGFSVISEFTFGNIVLDKVSFDVGNIISGKFQIPRLLNKNEKIIISIWDNYYREIESKEIKPAGTSVPFHFTSFKPLTTLHWIQVRLLCDDKEVCEKKLTFPIRAKLHWDDFNSVVWAGGWGTNTLFGYITYQMLCKLKKDYADVIDMPFYGYGFRIHPSWSLTSEESKPYKIYLQNSAHNTAMANLSILPYNWQFRGNGTEDINAVPQHCLNNPDYRKKIENDFGIDAEIFGPYGPFAWTHGDESMYSENPNFCWCKYCLSKFREYLKEKYKSVELLNKEWRTNYVSWDKVMPISFKDAKEKMINNPGAWVEHCLFNDRVFAGIYDYAEDVLKKNDPSVRNGFDGAQGEHLPNIGLDWWLLSRRSNGILQTYMVDSRNMEIIRSFANRNQITGMWYGTYGLTWQLGPNTVPFCHFFPWYSLFHQLNTTWFWNMGSPGYTSGYAPDLTSLPFFESTTKALKEIKSGIGKLLLNGTRMNDNIGIHYSEVSRIVDSLYAIKESDWSYGWCRALSNFNKALEDNGLQYDYLSYEQVEEGKLIKNNFKVFIMLHSWAISEREAKEIRKFVEKGGIVIADVIPGIRNEHSTLCEPGLLSDLFPRNNQPEVTITSFGEGKTILTGNLLEGYGEAHMNMNGWKYLEGRWKMLGDILKKQAGIIPKVEVIPKGSGEIPPTEITRIKCDRIEFIGLLREYYLYDNDSYECKVNFPYKSHVYDVINGKYLGFTDSIDTEISYEVKLYALSPYKVDSISVGLSDVKAGTITSCKISLKTEEGIKPSMHVFHIEVIDSDGNIIPYYSQNIMAENGIGLYEIQWAINEKEGKYKIRVQDAMSGISAEKITTLKR